MNQAILNNEKWKSTTVYSGPFWLPLVAMLLFSLSFMGFPNTSVHASEGASSLAEVKFLLHIVAVYILGFVFLHHQKGLIANSMGIRLYIVYCFLVLLSVLFYTVTTGKLNLVIFARWVDLVFLLAVIFVFSRMETEKSFLICFLAISTPVFIVLLTYIFFPELALRAIYESGIQVKPRLGGSLVPPNTLGGIAGLSLMMTWGIRGRRFLKVLLSLIFLTVVVFSQSRMAILALSFSLFVSYIFMRGKVTKKFVTVFVLLFVMVVGFFAIQFGLLGIEIVPDRMVKNLGTFSGRIELWQSSLSVFSEGSMGEILFGLGFWFPEHTFRTGSLVTHSLHNSYLQVLVGTGPITVCVYVLMLFLLLRVEAPRSGLTLSLRAIAIFNIVWGLSEIGPAVKLNYFSILLALLIAQCYRQKLSKTKNSKFSGRPVSIS
jgi:O-antigen ligase